MTYEQVLDVLDAYMGTCALAGPGVRVRSPRFDRETLTRLLATGDLLLYVARRSGVRRGPHTAPLIYGAQKVWRELCVKRAERAERVAPVVGPTYVERLRVRLRQRQERDALEAAQAYHRQVRALYASKYGEVQLGRGGEVVERSRYSKSWHSRYGPARHHNAGVTVHGDVIVLHPVRGAPVTLSLTAWRERQAFVRA